MRKPLLLALMALPLLFLSCKKGGNPLPIFPETYYEQSPQNGRSSITFHANSTFTVTDLRLSSGPLRFEYKYKIKDGKMEITPPPVDSYWHPNPLYYDFKDGLLTITNFRPALWTEKVELVTFKKM